jgi:chromosome segregation ATPase
MTDSGKTKRTARPGRRASKPPRDARAEEATPTPPETRRQSAPATNVVSNRLSALQAEVARLTRERAADADDMAAMLVRVADSERSRTAAVTMATEAEARVEGLEAELGKARASSDEARQAREAVEDELRGIKDAAAVALERAAQAEQAAYESADGLSRTRIELEEQIARAGALETRLLRAETQHTEIIDSIELEHASSMDALRREHAASLEALRHEHTAGLDKLRTEHAAAVGTLRKDHAAALVTAAQKHVADARAIEGRLSAELTSLRERHAAELEALKTAHAEASRKVETQHAAALTALREEHATARRTASYALEEERSASARLRQQGAVSESRLTALRAAIGRATQALVDQEHRDGEAAVRRAKALKEATDALREDPVPAPTPAKAAPRLVPSTPDTKAAALDEIDIDLPD